ncbi:hypothetical protein AURDEDRAFT_177177 [Auricularia subglabra TFB-10046 SS5]|uniref:Uncharacterized protein n=1 Tax=Auricularia subglabra (strain TFB-10046 / SS5) TaxID=717982 RepID=J0WPE7_AURST|nr:hypothetical protein AURDEDRAFT_177177 [Auricularia subglabra TFB-10046 SS5]
MLVAFYRVQPPRRSVEALPLTVITRNASGRPADPERVWNHLVPKLSSAPRASRERDFSGKQRLGIDVAAAPAFPPPPRASCSCLPETPKHADSVIGMLPVGAALLAAGRVSPIVEARHVGNGRLEMFDVMRYAPSASPSSGTSLSPAPTVFVPQHEIYVRRLEAEAPRYGEKQPSAVRDVTTAPRAASLRRRSTSSTSSPPREMPRSIRGAAAVQQPQAHRAPSSPPPPKSTLGLPVAPLRPHHRAGPPNRRCRRGGASIGPGIAVIIPHGGGNCSSNLLTARPGRRLSISGAV